MNQEQSPQNQVNSQAATASMQEGQQKQLAPEIMAAAAQSPEQPAPEQKPLAPDAITDVPGMSTMAKVIELPDNEPAATEATTDATAQNAEVIPMQKPVITADQVPKPQDK